MSKKPGVNELVNEDFRRNFGDASKQKCHFATEPDAQPGRLVVYIIFLAFSIGFTQPLFAPPALKMPDQFLLEGEIVEYDNDNGLIFASGNVEITYKDYKVFTDRFTYFTKEKTMIFPNKFLLKREALNISAGSVTYNITTLSGEAKDVKTQIDKITIIGNNIRILPDKVEIKEASFSTCTKDEKHYEVKASSLEVYPQWGMFVAMNDVLYLYNRPIFYFPTYVYASKAYSVLGAGSPIPEVGRNNSEGWFIKEKWGYFIDRNSSGTIDFGYTELTNWFSGFNHSLKFTPNQTSSAKLYYIQKFGFTGGWAYYIDFTSTGNETFTENRNFLDNLLTEFIPRQQNSLSLFSIQFYYHELINNYWVDYAPLLKLQLKENTSPLFGYKLNTDINLGYIGEYQPENNYIWFRTSRISINENLNQKFKLSSFWLLDSNLFYYGNWYDRGNSWQRLLVKIGFTFDYFDFKPSISYTKMLHNSGQSSFSFDSVDTEQADEIGLKFQSEIIGYNTLLEINYNIENMRPRTIDLLSKISFHCWNLSLKARFIQKDLVFGLELN